MYVAVKGGERAIAAAHRLLAEERRGDPTVPELSVAQIAGQLRGAVDRVMSEGSLYDEELAALAIKQAGGDLLEAAFLLRAFRSTLPRIAYSVPVDTGRMYVRRRVSATFKDVPGGQLLGPTFDYTHRLLDFSLLENTSAGPPADTADTGGATAANPDSMHLPTVAAILEGEGLMEKEAVADQDLPVRDLTREAVRFPAPRDLRLQALARADEGFLLGLGYSTQRGFGSTHPFVGELRVGEVQVEVLPPELGFAIPMGRVTLTECQMVNQFRGSQTEPPQFTRGYGLSFGQNERKAMSMALVDRALRGRELGEEADSPARDEEFVLLHSDNVQAMGFVEHLKLPHHVDFQAELEQLRAMREAAQAAPAEAAGKEDV